MAAFELGLAQTHASAVPALPPQSYGHGSGEEIYFLTGKGSLVMVGFHTRPRNPNAIRMMSWPQPKHGHPTSLGTWPQGPLRPECVEPGGDIGPAAAWLEEI